MSNQPLTLSSREIDLHPDPMQVGGKALNLLTLVGSSLPVPPFFVLLSAAFRLHLKALNISADDADLGADQRTREIIRNRIISNDMPPHVAAELEAARDELVGDLDKVTLAVRSSGASEDLVSASFAGQYESFLGIKPADVVTTVKYCWASGLNDRVVAYRSHQPEVRQEEFAVIVQQQVMSRRSGVLFTLDPVSGDTDTICIEANFGTGESVVSGMTTPDLYRISRSGLPPRHTLGTKRKMTVVTPTGGNSTVATPNDLTMTPVLDEDDLYSLVDVVPRIEDAIPGPLDIEWTFDNKQLWILQARPVTATGRSNHDG